MGTLFISGYGVLGVSAVAKCFEFFWSNSIECLFWFLEICECAVSLKSGTKVEPFNYVSYYSGID